MNKQKITMVAVIIALCAVIISLIYMRANAVCAADCPHDAVETEPAENLQQEEQSGLEPVVIREIVYVPEIQQIEYLYTPVDFDGERMITPDTLEELPDFERCVAIMAQMLWGEIRGGSDDAVAAVCWCVCNRAAQRTPAEVIVATLAPGQFHGYDPEHPIDERLYGIAENVLIQWMMEPYTTIGINRILPEDYKWFRGDGQYNTFRNSFIGGTEITVR